MSGYNRRGGGPPQRGHDQQHFGGRGGRGGYDRHDRYEGGGRGDRGGHSGHREGGGGRGGGQSGYGGRGGGQSGYGGGGRGGGRGGFSGGQPEQERGRPSSALAPASEREVESLRIRMRSMDLSKIEQPAKEYTKIVNGVCSLFHIEIQPGRKAYRYDVDIINISANNGKGKSLVRGANDDGMKSLQRDICYELLVIAYTRTAKFGMGEGCEVVYDNKATLFTNFPLKIDNEYLSVEIMRSNNIEMPYTFTNSRNDAVFKVMIKQNEECPELDLNDLKQYKTKESKFHEDRSLRTFLEMALGQFAINTLEYVSIGSGRLYGKDEKSVVTDTNAAKWIELRKGLAKGVRIVRNDRGDPIPSVVLDAKISPFFKSQSLADTVGSLIYEQRREHQVSRDNRQFEIDWDKILKVLENLRVQVSYRKSHTFKIDQFTSKPLKDLKADINGEKLSLVRFFKEKYNFEIGEPEWPAIIPQNSKDPPSVFPIEVLLVMENQRIIREKMDIPLQEELLRLNSVRPAERMNNIFQCARQMCLFNGNNVLEGFGIRVNKDSNKIFIGIRSLPKIQFGQNRVLMPDLEKANWFRTNDAPYETAHTLSNWILINDDKISGIVDEFISRLIVMARRKGMKIEQPTRLSFKYPNGTRPRPENWLEFFQKFVKPCKNLEYIMLVDKKWEDTHGLLKYFEALYKIPTQQVTFEKAREVVEKNRNQTLENILNKMNCKNFGLNYVPLVNGASTKYNLAEGNVLVIGYDVSHPAPMNGNDRRKFRILKEEAAKYAAEKKLQQSDGTSTSESDGEETYLNLTSSHPSIVGICANMAPNPHNFVGDYFYQKSRKEDLDYFLLKKRVKWILQNVQKHRPKHPTPPYIFIFRDGLSEGQFDMALKDELQAIRDGCKEYGECLEPRVDYNPQIVFTVGTKRHFKRMFAGEYNGNKDSDLCNVPPGSVIADYNVVRADVSQLFMQPHFPLKGSAKPVEYSILTDDVNITQDEIQGLLLSLCYSHQIVNSAISIPEPVYQADELAKRGRNNFLTMAKFFKNELPYTEYPIPQSKNKFKIVDAKELNKRFCYWDNGHRLIKTRYTA